MHGLRPRDDQAARPDVAAPDGGRLNMADTIPSGIKVLNYGLATFLIALPTMILLYKLVISIT
jgi:hypothetical protein